MVGLSLLSTNNPETVTTKKKNQFKIQRKQTECLQTVQNKLMARKTNVQTATMKKKKKKIRPVPLPLHTRQFKVLQKQTYCLSNCRKHIGSQSVILVNKRPSNCRDEEERKGNSMYCRSKHNVFQFVADRKSKLVYIFQTVSDPLAPDQTFIVVDKSLYGYDSDEQLRHIVAMGNNSFTL